MRLGGLGVTVWSIVAVVAVLVGGVFAVQWATRSDDSSSQNSSLAGLDVRIPQPNATASDAPSPSAHPSATTSAKATVSSTIAATPQGQPSVTAPTSGSGGQAPSGSGDSAGSGQQAPVDRPTTSAPVSEAPVETTPEDEEPDPVDAPNPLLDLIAGHLAKVSSQGWNLVAGNITDGDPETYWEGGLGFPQTVTVDLGESASVGRLVLSLPPNMGWHSRTQTIAVQGSPDGRSFSTLKSAATYTFDGKANQVTITFTPQETRHLRLRFTGGVGWWTAQLSGLSAHAS